MDVNIKNIIAVSNVFVQYCAMRKKRKENYVKEILMLEQQKIQNTLLLDKLLKKKQKRVVKRSCWVYPELLLNASGKFWENAVPLYNDDRFFHKMSPACFNKLCADLRPLLEKKNTNFQLATPVGKSIAVALIVLKGNIDFCTIADLFGIGRSTVGYLLHEFCAAIILHYSHLIKFPKTEEERGIIADRFWNKWQFYGCFGSIDGTHIAIIPPSDQTIEYYNYKGFYTINVPAVVDDKYRFTYILTGSPGRCNDPSILRKSSLFEIFDNTKPKIPEFSTNYHLIADAVFPLLTWLTKPFPEILKMSLMNKNFYYRLSSAQMVIENAFGRLKALWRILSRRPNVHLDAMRHIIKACIILHNLCENSGEEVPQEWITSVAEEEQILIENVLMPNTNEETNNTGLISENASECILDVEESVTAKMKRIKLVNKLFTDGLSIVET